MRFFILSDLHLEKGFGNSTANHILERLCKEIRKNIALNTTILFIILGDIAHKGTENSFEYAEECLEYIKTELSEYTVKFEFVPGNHDLQADSLTAFDNIVKTYGNNHSFENQSTYSSEYKGINFIFADSNLSRNHKLPGKIDIESIRLEIKQDKRNVLFCHHALSHSHGDTHDTIEDSASVIRQLNEMGIDFFFHGHVHQSDITIPEKGMVEIGSGCLSGDLSFAEGNIQHQFTVGYIQNNNIVCVERWVDNTDGNEIFASNQLFPEPKSFLDPSDIGKTFYEPIDGYISRSVLPYELATGDVLSRYLSNPKSIPLDEALQENSKVLLICDAGMGKSIELSHLASVLCGKFHTFLYSLKDYDGEEIIDLLPSGYKGIHHNRVALLLDGYDELSSTLRETFEKKLRRYIKDNESSHIVITSRSNFCKVESNDKSKAFPQFSVYVLDKLDGSSISAELNRKGINETQFWNEATAKKVDELLSNPFYLTKLIELYLDEKSLPNKSDLMDKLIEEGFELDEDKYSGSLNDQYHKLFKSLEIIAFSMQLMHKYVLEDRREYQDLFEGDIRTLVKQSGLFKQERNGWSFSHNNFREYLAAKQLSKLPKEQAIEFFASGTGIKPSWINTLGYLVNFDLSWDLQGWLSANAPSALVKFEPDRLDHSQRIDTFKQIFTHYENKRLHLNDELCDTLELAHFADSNEVLSFLIERIQNPRHFTSQYTALNILRHFPKLYGKNNTIRNVLLDCCKLYPTTDKVICRLAMLVLCQQNLNNTDVTTQLFEIFGESQEDYIRLGMYEYLIYTNELDFYSKYFLDGIKHIHYTLNDNDTRIGNESFELVNGLKKMSTLESIRNIFEWFSKKHVDFHDSDKVFSSAVNTAIKLYNQGNTELYDIVLSCYLSSTKEYNSYVEQTIVKFFKETNTQFNAAIVALDEFEEKPHHIYYLLNCDETLMDNLKEAYMCGELENHSAFQNIVVWYIRDEKTYVEYARIIKDIDEIDIPEYSAPIDYDLLKKQASQDFFDMLFDKEKRSLLFSELVSSINNADATTDQILELGQKIRYDSAIERLQSSIFHYGRKTKITEFFDVIDLEDFIIWSASKYLGKNSSIVPTQNQKRMLSELVLKKLEETTFQDPVIYYENGYSLKYRVRNFLSLIIYLDLPISKNTILQFTELPRELFSEKCGVDKYVYLESKLSDSELKSQLIENIATGKVKDMILKDHIDYFDKICDESIAEYALELCKQEDIYIRYSSWQYLLHSFGSEYIQSEILPFADGEFLMEINSHCKDIDKKRMREFMEEQYKTSPSSQLQAHLITLESKLAINKYVDYVKTNKNIPEGKAICTDGATRAIGSICNTDFIPLLETLLDILFDNEFVDGEWYSLRNSLSQAFLNCSKKQPLKTIEIITAHIPDGDCDERNFRYCNQIIEDIQSEQKSQQDKPLEIHEVKQILKDICVA